MKPSDAQQAALVLAMAEGYVRPASATHARRCNTTSGSLDRTCRSLVRAGLMRSLSEARYQATDAGQALVPSRPMPRPISDGVEWARF